MGQEGASLAGARTESGRPTPDNRQQGAGSIQFHANHSLCFSCQKPRENTAIHPPYARQAVAIVCSKLPEDKLVEILPSKVGGQGSSTSKEQRSSRLEKRDFGRRLIFRLMQLLSSPLVLFSLKNRAKVCMRLSRAGLKSRPSVWSDSCHKFVMMGTSKATTLAQQYLHAYATRNFLGPLRSDILWLGGCTPRSSGRTFMGMGIRPENIWRLH